MILIVKHVAIEGPGTIGTFFEQLRWDMRTVELQEVGASCCPCGHQDAFPDDLSCTEAIIILGGPMNVYEENKYPFLKEEHVFIEEALRREIPILGICLGAQLLAKAAGAKIHKADCTQIGWDSVELTPEGIEDHLFSGLPARLRVFQWHEDTFELPTGAVLLATSQDCRNQAFRVGKNAYGLQFHVEVTDREIKDWFDEYCAEYEPL